jgi:multidrug efflux pump subunit AcrB
MVNFFIHRPVFASVIAVIMILTGLIAYSLLPVAQFPDITPPQVVVAATSPDRSVDLVTLSNYTYLQLIDPLKRLPGTGDVTIFGERR